MRPSCSINFAALKNGAKGIVPAKFSSALGLCFLLVAGQTAPLLANPSGGAVVAGSATIGSAGATLSINQSTQKAIINWQQFSIAGGETTKFIVPNSGATLNRVVGGNLSAIYGSLQSNGALYLINPNGILVGPSGRINTTSFLGSTLDVTNQQFLAGGDLNLTGSSSAPIDNEGIIHATGGDVYLIANQVTNAGTLSAPHGTVGLAAGNDVLFKQAGSQHLFVSATPAGTKRAVGVTNSGTIRAAAAELKAAGGNAYALAINNTGAIAATGYKKINGQVYLTSDGGSISNSGTISAHQANGNGGTIVMDGTAKTSTTSGTVTNSGTLEASAPVAGGTGGSVTIKNMGGTTVHTGVILAQGGQGGIGGFAEISGKTVTFTGLVNLTSPGGTTGTLLLDPATLNVITGGTGTYSGGQNDPTSTTIDPTTVETALSTANLVLNADTNITISSGITWTSGSTLTLMTNDSGSTIVINAPISGVNGGLTIDPYYYTDVITANAAVNVGTFSLENGNWTQFVGQNGLTALPAFSATNFELGGSSTFQRFAGIDSNHANAYEIADVYGLQGLGSPSGSLESLNTELVNNIDATGTSAWNSGTGFTPLPSSDGTFNGQGLTINGLTINRPSTYNVGLFGTIVSSTVENVGLTNVQITGAGNTGGIAGTNEGTISGSFVSGTVNGGSSIGVGGLVGNNSGSIIGSYNAAAVIGGSDLGGVAGFSTGTISEVYNLGTVTASVADGEGGVIGFNDGGTLTNAYNSGTVNASSGDYVGGVIGANFSTMTNTYNTGAVNAASGTELVGAIAGDSYTTYNSFFDTETSVVTVGNGSGSTSGITPATTAQLESQTFILANSPTSPTWDFTNVWSTEGGMLAPQLIGLPPTTLPTGGSTDTLSGTVYLDGGVTADTSGSVVNLIYGDGLQAMTTASSSGAYSFSIVISALTGGVLLTDAADNGNTFYQSNDPGLTINGVDLWGNTLRVQADNASNTILGQTAGGVSGAGVNFTVTGTNLTTAQGVGMQILSHYMLDGNITASGVLSTTSGASLTGNTNVTLTGSSVDILGSTFDLTGSLNVTSTTGSIDLSGVGRSSDYASAEGITFNSAGATEVDFSYLSTDGANFSATGTGYASGSDDSGIPDGVDLFDSTIYADGGNITLNGTGGYVTSEGSIDAGPGVAIGTDGEAPSLLSTYGNGSISITGTFNQAVTSVTDIFGVEIYTDALGESNLIDVGNGALSVTGTVSRGMSAGNVNGVEMTGGSELASSGSIAINGTTTGSTGMTSNVGVLDQGSGLYSSGNLSITGAAAGANALGVEALPGSGAGLPTIAAAGTLTVASTAGGTLLDSYNTAGAMVINGGAIALPGTTIVGSLAINASGAVSLGPTISSGATIVNVTNGASLSQTGLLATGLLSATGESTITLTNASNEIFALGAITHSGAVTIYTDPGLAITGLIQGNAPVTIAEVGGNIVFGPNGSIVDSGIGNNVILAAGADLASSRYIINDATGNAIQVSNGAHFNLYSSDPTYDSLGNISVQPGNMVYNATFASTGSPTADQELFYVAAAGDLGPNSPYMPPPMMTTAPSTTTGGAADAGSNIVPVTLTPQITQLTQTTEAVVTTAGNTTPPAFSFTGTGTSGQGGQQDGGLASASGNGGQVSHGDAAQLSNGELNNVANPHATGALNEALGPIVFHNLEGALESAGDFTDADDTKDGGSSSNTASSGNDSETILTGGEVAEVRHHKVKHIPLKDAPDQLQVALDDTPLDGGSADSGH